MSLEKRVQKLEDRAPRRRRTNREMTDDELAEIITGIPGTKSDDLTDDYLESIIKGEHPASPGTR